LEEAVLLEHRRESDGAETGAGFPEELATGAGAGGVGVGHGSGLWEYWRRGEGWVSQQWKDSAICDDFGVERGLTTTTVRRTISGTISGFVQCAIQLFFVSCFDISAGVEFAESCENLFAQTLAAELGVAQEGAKVFQWGLDGCFRVRESEVNRQALDGMGAALGEFGQTWFHAGAVRFKHWRRMDRRSKCVVGGIKGKTGEVRRVVKNSQYFDIRVPHPEHQIVPGILHGDSPIVVPSISCQMSSEQPFGQPQNLVV
jgi:hypothetical protein